MDKSQQEFFERQLFAIAKGMDYPRTPDVAGTLIRQISEGKGVRGEGWRVWRLAWSVAAIVVLFLSLMLIPPARAAILEFIEVGVVRIFRIEPTPLKPPQQQFPATMAPVTATSAPTPVPLIPLLEKMAGAMTLEEAADFVEYPILLPSFPPDLGPPDRVFVQDADGPMTILVWVDPEKPDNVLMSLHFLPPDSWAIKKVEPALVQETTVHGQYAIWAIGPYPVRFSNGNLDFVRMIRGHVLIWAEEEITYRLETSLSLQEAVRVAESLAPVR